jgi:hypothetical protein
MNAGLDVAHAGQEDDWPRGRRSRELTLQLNPIQPWHANVEQQAARRHLVLFAQETFRRFKRSDMMSRRGQYARQRVADLCAILDYEHCAQFFVHASLLPCRRC